MTPDNPNTPHEPTGGLEHLAGYPLLDAVLERRSRRFSTGMAIEATVAPREYVRDRYGRFPATAPAFHTLVGFQAGHVDEAFSDHHYRRGPPSDSHREHMARWH